MSFQRSTRDLKQEVLKISGELTDGTSPFDSDAVSYLNTVYKYLITGNSFFDVSCDEPWVWAQAKYPITLALKPSVAVAATLTNASTSGTFGTAPSTSLEGRYLKIPGVSDIYRITQHTAAATAFQIDQEFLGTTGSYNVNAYKYDYDAFNDVIVVSSKNNKIDFTEGGAELTATLTPGSYSPTTLCTEIDTRITAAGAQSYTVSFNTINRKFTLASAGTSFSLLFGSGTNSAISASSILGFDQDDQTGALTYSSGYALSAIARISKPISIYKNGVSFNLANKDSNKIFMIDDNSFLRDYPMNRLDLAIPDKFCPVEQNPDGLWTLRFNASVQEECRIEVNYIPVARTLQDNANSFPLVPGAFSDFLVYGAAHFIQVDKSDSKAQDSLNKAISQLKALIEFNRQGSQIAGNSFGKLTPRMSQMPRQWGSGSAY